MSITEITGQINAILWSKSLIYVCLAAGLYFSIRTAFPQIRLFKDMVKLLLSGKSSKSGVSSFQGFAMALGGRVGIGNIAGVATAIFYGGPGAIFWMWVIAFFGAGSAYVESSLSQVWKEDIGGEYRGGPAFYIEKGLKSKVVAVIFTIAVIIACGFTGPGIQAFNIADSFKNAFGISPLITGIGVAALFTIVIFGGVKRIGKFAEIVVPVMAIAYIVVALVIVAIHITEVPAMFKLIFSSAFNMNATFGGIFGNAVLWGIKRGVYSNEAGQGTGAMAAGAAEVSHPAKQGLVQAFSVYVDTLFVCTATAIMILSTGAYNVVDNSGAFIVENLPDIGVGVGFTQAAIDTLLPGVGGAFIAIAMFFFAFTTLLSFAYYAMSNVAFLFKDSKHLGVITNVVRVIQVVMVVFASVKSSEFAWNLADIGVGMIAWINILSILIIGKYGFATLKDYEEQKKMGLDPVFVPERCGIDNAPLWNKIAKENYPEELQKLEAKLK
ncbi:alanine/glycine:cation symporter family protein [Sinanaerobacter sp. ZZT-01]|uniref:alanine/glycine:cation symporter family protein n=1 Tax=Sinanaerobacter sp. ZZT-01 TaxID=3111540 RepID=UPI002D798A2B|nr:alanine/glycine:cation symporter family protein [Sinanaerobacter sp. ZZT-01]WRR92159.1 alanine/glycine:cation symporter family protein [Sinanaerobacter sp. ZZT-01]